MEDELETNPQLMQVSAHGSPDATRTASPLPAKDLLHLFQKAQEPIQAPKPQTADVNHSSTTITSVSPDLLASDLHLSCISVTCVTAN